MIQMQLYDTDVGQKRFFYGNDEFWVSKVMDVSISQVMWCYDNV